VSAGQDQSLLEVAAFALADTYSEKSGDGVDPERLHELVMKAAGGLKTRAEVDPDSLRDLIETLHARPTFASGIEYSRRQVARWFEVELDEFDETPFAQLEPEVLYRHIHYEDLLKNWFVEFGYQVTVGEELEGAEGSDFVPDVHASIKTLHGDFSVAITLFCDDPPNTMRALGMLENLEAYAPKGSEFGTRDIYLMVTPFQFREKASHHIRIQSREEDYFVVALEGNDLHDLESAGSVQGRMDRLHNIVQSVARVKGVEPF